MPGPDDSLKLTHPYVRLFFYTGIPRPPLPNFSKLRRTCLGTGQRDNATAKPYSVNAADSRLLSGECWIPVDGTVTARGRKPLPRGFFLDATRATRRADIINHFPAATNSSFLSSSSPTFSLLPWCPFLP